MVSHSLANILMTPYRLLRLTQLRLWERSNTERPPFVEHVTEEPIHFEVVTRNTSLRLTPVFTLATNISSNTMHHHRLLTPDSPGGSNKVNPEMLSENSDEASPPAALPSITSFKKILLSRYLGQWQKITDKWLLAIIKYGHTLEFTTAPPPHPRQKSIPPHLQLLKKEALILLQKGAIECVPASRRGRGFYSSFFLVKKLG